MLQTSPGRMRVIFLTLLLSFQVLGDSIVRDPLVVLVKDGKLRGKYVITRDGRQVFAFLGVPFAQPPIGELRFKSPQPPTSWTGVRNATSDGHPCVQNNLLNYLSREVTFGSEDCLYLNVFTPTLSRTAKLPVMVYIFGGGFTSGSPTSDLYGPDYFLDHDVVLVVINYRNGPLGFLSTEDEHSPGNYGLKDQTFALKWVQKNINVFGGDSASVTLFGNSAGAGSVHLHMMSPLSQGLFHGGISQSGSALCQWALHPPGSNRETAFRVGREFNCNTDNSEALMSCLREVPAYNITQLLYKYLEFDLDPAVVFSPSLESNSSTAFLTQDPWTLSPSIPWIAGTVSQEGSMRTSSLTRGGAAGEARVARLDAEYEQLLPASIMVEKHAKDPVNISTQVKQFYFGNDDISKARLSDLINMYSDSWFSYCTLEAVTRHSGPVYQYYLSYKGEKTTAPLFGNSQDDLGVCHVDELIYLFPLNLYFPNRNDTQVGEQFSRNLIEMWVNFARYRNPTPTSNSNFSWTPVSSQREYLELGNNGYSMGTNLLEERFNFWRNLPFREKPVPTI
uniref:Carboxylic ester hydrolase n=1 Tax=Clastoptera arizonana TaxID=38151 RepID=A0A1B6C5A2_9HEMI